MTEPARTGKAGRLAAAALTLLILPLGLARIFENMTPQLPEPVETLARYTSPFQVVNSYGLFAVMTTERLEIVVEGSDDGQQWRAYEFPYKPGDVNRAPRWAAPYQPRLDWQMWFAALGDYRTNPWFVAFAERLLEGSPEVLALLAEESVSGSSAALHSRGDLRLPVHYLGRASPNRGLVASRAAWRVSAAGGIAHHGFEMKVIVIGSRSMRRDDLMTPISPVFCWPRAPARAGSHGQGCRDR